MGRLTEVPLLIATDDAARYIGVSRSTLEKWRFFRNPNGPPVIQIGRTVRYKISDLENWAEMHRRIDAGQPLSDCA